MTPQEIAEQKMSSLPSFVYNLDRIIRKALHEVAEQARSEALEEDLKAVSGICIAKTDKSVDFDVGFSWGIKVAMNKIEEIRALKSHDN